MANLLASKKDVVKSRKNRIENVGILSRARTEVKKFLKLLQSDTELKVLENQLSVVNSVCSIAAKKKIYHKNKTARIMSRLSHKMKRKFKND